MPKLPSLFLSIVLCLLIGTGASAEPTINPAAVGLSWDSVGSASVQGADGGFSVSTVSARADLWRFSLLYRYSDFHWHGVDSIPMGDGVRPPWDHLQTLELSFRALDATAGSWRFVVNPVVQSSFERELGGSLGFGAKGVVSWEIGGGWGVYFPYTVLGFSNHGDPSLMISVTIGLDFPEKPIGDTLKKWGAPDWLAESIDLRLEFSSLQQFYHLDTDNPLDPDGILWVEDSVISLIFVIMPNDHLVISLGPQYHFSRSASLDLPGGDGDRAWDIADAWGFTLRAGWKF